MTRVYHTSTEEETAALGGELAKKLTAGCVVALTGELGAGKSALARGIARALGITGRMPSPSFTILNRYEGEIPFNHVDAYRLEDEDELFETGYYEYIKDGVTVVEWPGNVPGAIPADALRVTIEKTAEGRTITVNI